MKGLLDEANPERSWDQPADIKLIRLGLKQLRCIPGRIALSYPGAGNGRLPQRLVRAAVLNELGQDVNPRRFIIVEYSDGAARAKKRKR